jgi:predicted RNase H-like HicB family nuclease
MVFHVTLAKAEDAWIVAECPALPGCVSQGKDDKEALANIKEAIAAWLWTEDRRRPWMKHIGKLKGLRKETQQINKVIEEAFEEVDVEPRRHSLC